MAYGRGFEAVQEAAAKAAAYVPGASYNVTHPVQQPWNFSWKEGETKTVRFLSDGLVSAPFYDYLPTLDGNHSEFVDTSAIEGPLNRPDIIGAKFKNDKNKPLRPTMQTLGMVVERKLNPATKKWEDVMGEFEVLEDPDDPNSDKVTVEWPRFWVIRKGRRFWDLLNEFYVEDDRFTTVDRNFSIKRIGKGTSTTYFPKALREDPEDANTPKALVNFYQIPAPDFEGLEGYDPKTLEQIESDPVMGWIIKFVERRATEQWFQKITGTPSEKPSAAASRPSRPAEPDSNDQPSEEAMAGLKDRLSASKKKYEIAGKK